MNDTVFQAERHLAALILAYGSKAINSVSGSVSETDFDNKLFGEIYAAALRLNRENSSFDAMAIYNAVNADDADPQMQDFVELMDSGKILAGVNIRELAKTVHSAAIVRAQQAVGFKLAAGEIDAAEATRRLQTLERSDRTSCLVSSNDAVQRLADYVDAETSHFVSTGYTELDRVLSGGFIGGGLYILAARPAVGKSAVAVNIAERISERGDAVLYLSFEMTGEQITARRLGIAGQMAIAPFLNGEFKRRAGGEALRRYGDALQFLSTKPFSVVDRACSLANIEGYIRSADGLKLCVVDYLGLINEHGRSLYEKITAISGRLKQIALSTGIPILALAQLNRASEQRDGKRPILSDLRDSGSIEQDADAVILLHRDMGSPELSAVVAKNRHGSTGCLQFTFDGCTQTVREVCA